MQRFISFICLCVTIGLCLGNASEASEAQPSYTKDMLQQEMAMVCEYYPQQCPLDNGYQTNGAGNGGGNEPPYKPKKPTKPKAER